MKFLLSLLFVITFCNAETIYNGQCVDSYYTGNDTVIYYYRSATPTTLRSMSESKSKIQELRNNTDIFYYDSDTNTCVAYMEDKNHIFMMSLTGLICGTLIASIIMNKVT